MITGSELISFGVFSSPLPANLVIGEPATVLDQADDFENLPVWADLENSLLIHSYVHLRDFTKQNVQRTIALSIKFLILAPGAHAPTLAQMRYWLETVFYLFRGPRLSKISKREAFSLYRRLGLDGGTGTFGEAHMPYRDRELTAKIIIEALGDYYQDFV